MSPAPYKHALLIANPIAGRGKGIKAAGALARELEARGVSVVYQPTSQAGDARRFALEAGDPTDVIFSVGGDGTLREILEGLTANDSPLPVATLPMGTANVLALDFELPTKPAVVADLAIKSQVRQLDLAQVTTAEGTQMTSFLAVGIGLDSEVVERLHQKRTGAITKLSYVPHALCATASYRAPKLTVEIDGIPVEEPCRGLLLANVINFGGFIKLDPETKSDDGLWELYSWQRGDRRELASTVLRGALGKLPSGPCQRRLVRRVKVSCDPAVPYHVDGDHAGRTPFTFEVTGRRATILVPEATPAPLR